MRFVEGMRIVGIDFRDGILFVPEVLLAANSMKGGMEILRPLLAENRCRAHRQDCHRHGEGRTSTTSARISSSMMLEGAGFEVIDLGINNPVEKVSRRARGAQA